MPLARSTLAALLVLATPALADGIGVHDARAYAALAGATNASAYMTIHNHGGAPDRLLGATSPDAASVTLHAAMESADGMMRMEEVAEGLPLPTDGAIDLAPGGLHLMMTGLAVPVAPGGTIAVTLDFEVGPDLTLRLPVEIQGGMEMGGHAGHGG